MRVRSFFISLLVALSACCWNFQASSQTTTTVTVFWTTGWCSICGPTVGNYACASGSGSGQWNAGIRTFFDPVPAAGNTVCNVDVTVNKVDCGLTNLCVLLNGNSLGCLPPTVGSNCSCGACWPLFYSKPECPFTGYVYGGINTIDLNNVGNLCVNNCVIDITYSTTCNCLILPINLLAFNAKYNGNTVDVTWTTASETNNDYFTIERSFDEENFVTIGTVKGAGTSSHENQYSIEDSETYSGLVYYRLKQTDNDGSFEYSDLVSLNVEYQNDFFTLAPNPASDATELSFYSFRNEDVTIGLYDAMGRLSRTVTVNSNPGLNIVSMDTHHLQKGIYHVVLTGANKVRSTKLVIDK